MKARNVIKFSQLITSPTKRHCVAIKFDFVAFARDFRRGKLEKLFTGCLESARFVSTRSGTRNAVFFFFLIKLSFSFQLDHQFRRNQQEILNQKNRITNKPGGTALDFTLKAAAFRLKVDCIKIKLVRAKDPRRDVIL